MVCWSKTHCEDVNSSWADRMQTHKYTPVHSLRTFIPLTCNLCAPCKSQTHRNKSCSSFCCIWHKRQIRRRSWGFKVRLPSSLVTWLLRWPLYVHSDLVICLSVLALSFIFLISAFWRFMVLCFPSSCTSNPSHLACLLFLYIKKETQWPRPPFCYSKPVTGQAGTNYYC